MKLRISEECSLKLAIKSLRGREATDEAKAATSSTSARRLQEDQADKVAKARARRRLNALIARATRPGVIYSEAVTKANFRRRRSNQSDVGPNFIPKCVSGVERDPTLSNTLTEAYYNDGGILEVWLDWHNNGTITTVISQGGLVQCTELQISLHPPRSGAFHEAFSW